MQRKQETEGCVALGSALLYVCAAMNVLQLRRERRERGEIKHDSQAVMCLICKYKEGPFTGEAAFKSSGVTSVVVRSSGTPMYGGQGIECRYCRN